MASNTSARMRRPPITLVLYCSDDPIQAKLLERIGSGMGILNPWNLALIVEQAKVPVLGALFRQ